MLPPSLRLLVRDQARPVPLQLQRCLNSTGTGSLEFTEFLEWARKNRAKRPQPRSGNVQGTRSLKKRKIKKIKGPESFRSTPGTMTREQRILKTVLSTFRNEKAPSPAVNNWPGENWNTDGWGLDSKSRVLHTIY